MRDMISTRAQGGGEGAGDDPTDIGLAQLVCYGGGKEEQGRTLLSLYSAYCQQVCVDVLLLAEQWELFCSLCCVTSGGAGLHPARS